MPIHPCLHPTCPNPATYKGRCPTHARAQDKQINRAGRSIYNKKRWRTTRERILTQHPICQRCGNAISTDVHHITDLADGSDPWNLEGLEALCHPCHSQITRRAQTAA